MKREIKVYNNYEVDYNDIDELCIPLVHFFNTIGLRTKFLGIQLR